MKECPACSRCYPDHVNHCPADGDALRLTIAGDTVLDGRYQLERRLGQGGMGAVFKGRHVFLKTTHAIKVILPDLVGNDPSLVTRFRQEAMAAAAIHHPNIISVTDFGVVNNTMPFLVMEFIEGRSLHELLAAEKRLDPARALEIMLAVADGVGEAHRQGIVHRDLKPLNIMLRDGHSADGGIKVLDFGLAKIKSTDLLGSFVAAKTQGLMGSPFYMAPEQWGDEEPDLLADVYSMGVILYQMLAGEVPFRGNSIPAIMKKHLAEPHAPLAEKGVEVPPEVERVIAHALEKEPARRTPSVEEFTAELRAALASVRPAEIGASTNPDIGLRTVAIAEPPTLHPAQPSEPPPARPRTDQLVTTDDLVAPSGALPRPGEGQGVDSTGPLDETSIAPLPFEEAGPDASGQHQQTNVAPAKATQPLSTHQQTSHPPAPSPAPQQPTSPLTTRNDGGQAPREAVSRGTVSAPPGPRPGPQPTPAPPAAPPRVSPMPPGDGLGVAVGAPGVSGVSAPARSRALPAILAAGGLIAVLCVVAAVYLFTRSAGDPGANATVNRAANAGPGANATANTTNTPAPSPQASPSGQTADMVALPGGTFQLGRNDVPPRTGDVSVRYQLWAYSQWPAHEVRVGSFFIDKTEVTNAEYAECVRAGDCAVPRDDREATGESATYWKPWEGNSPPQGQERWPVRNVSYTDAVAFAAWRSKRDGLRYRLPTEAEWEYAARGGGRFRLYPWGDEWADGRANVAAELPQPVGTYPQGATPAGAVDMIGNVWEWTSSQAAMYRGNDVLQLPPSEAGKNVVRGGSYQSRATGEEPITATARRWLSRDTRDPVVGFRLVRPSS